MGPLAPSNPSPQPRSLRDRLPSHELSFRPTPFLRSPLPRFVGAWRVGHAHASGCTVLTNDALPDDAGTFEGGGDAGPSTACTSCVTQECTGAWAVCLTDSRCVALRGCNNPFGESQGARDQCFCDNADASAPTPDGGADPLAAYARVRRPATTLARAASAPPTARRRARAARTQDDRRLVRRAGRRRRRAPTRRPTSTRAMPATRDCRMRRRRRSRGAERRPMLAVRRGQVWRPEEGVCHRQRVQRVPRLRVWLRRRRVRRRVWEGALDRQGERDGAFELHAHELQVGVWLLKACELERALVPNWRTLS